MHRLSASKGERPGELLEASERLMWSKLILTCTFPPALQKVVHPGTAEGMISHVSAILDRQMSEALSYPLGASHLETLVTS